MSLNNRIYFRENQPPEHGDSVHLPVSDRVHAIALSSLSFAVSEPEPEVSKGVVLPLYNIPDQGSQNKGSDTSTDLSPVCAM